MPSKLSWLALGFGAYLAFAVATLPAATAYRWFAPDTLRLSGVSGTVWSGSAALGSLPGLPLHDLRWRLAGWPLLRAHLSGEVEARLAEGFVSADAVVAPSAVRLHNVRASTSLPVLRSLLPIRGTQGMASLALDELRLRDGFPDAVVGTLRLNDLRVPPLMARQGAALIPLGDYEVQFHDGENAAVAAAIHDTGGPLEVDASLTLTEDRAYTLEGRLRARPDASAELVQGLELMTSEPDADGFRSFMLDGSL
jgi:general secretion pathway protein N